MMAAVKSLISTQNRRQVEQAQGTPCACDDRGTCGLHYDQLDDYQQARVRERAGITNVARGRVAGIIGSPRRG
jgi:hypothetical protein